MAGSGNTQIINGQSYVLYSPAWYAARQAEAQRVATAQGTAAGSALKATSEASGVPIGSSSSSSSSTQSGSSGSSGGAGLPATIGAPSLAGLTAAATGGGVQAPTGQAGGASSGYAHLPHVDTSAAEGASFARAKDQVGQEATGSLTGLRSALGGRGMLGSGLEERGTASVVNSAAGELGDVSRQQAVTRADEAQKEATTNFQGDISQRGQDFQKEEAANSLAGSMAMGGYQGQITQRGQDIQAQNAAKALELEQAQLNASQRSTALAGLEAALKVTAPSGLSY